MPIDDLTTALLKRCRKEFLPALDGDLMALIELAAWCLRPGGIKLRRGLRKSAGKFQEAFDWSRLDSTVLGVLYESLMEPEESAQSKQSRRRRYGAFYTPGYIVSFLVRSALDALGPRENSTPPAILDPACGGGAFLIAAFRELRQRFPKIEPRRIATECIFGIDADEEATRVSRLSVIVESGLPGNESSHLKKSIKVGDTLRQAVFSGRTFPIVVGNPPYRNLKRGIPEDLKEYCQSHYETAKGQWDISAPFVEVALERLLEWEGVCAFILPSPILLAENYQPVRELVLRNFPIAFGPAGKSFRDAGVEASLLVVKKTSPGFWTVVLEGRKNETIVQTRVASVSMLDRLPFKVFSHLADPDFLEPVLAARDTERLVRFGDYVKLTRGLELGKKGLDDTRKRKGARPVLAGEEVREFLSAPTREILITKESAERGFLKNPALWEGRNQLVIRRVASMPIAAVVTPPALALNTLYIAHNGEINPHSICALVNSEIFRRLFIQLFAFDDKLFPYLRSSQLAWMPIPRAALDDSKLENLSREAHEIAAKNEKAGAGAGGKSVVDAINSRVEELYLNSGVTWRKRQRPLRLCRKS